MICVSEIKVMQLNQKTNKNGYVVNTNPIQQIHLPVSYCSCTKIMISYGI